MNNIILRIVIIGLALIGVYKMFPQISGPVDYYIKNPNFQSGVVKPAVQMANKVLPEKIQIPTPNIMGVSSDYTEPPLKMLTDEITGQVASVAASILKESSKAVSDQFCTTIIEKIKTECGK